MNCGHMQGKFAVFVQPDMTAADCRETSVLGTQEMVHQIPAEPQEGNIEYKLMLVGPSEERLAHLTTQLAWRYRCIRVCVVVLPALHVWCSYSGVCLLCMHVLRVSARVRATRALLSLVPSEIPKS